MIRAVWIMLLLIPSISVGQDRYSVIINEIMADPSPVVSLPNIEWIELKNVSATPINLQGWRIADQTSVSGPMPSFILKPDSLLIICPSSDISQLSIHGSCIPVTSFPSLDNERDLLSLKAVNGSIIHAVNYNVSWYYNELKKQGGWSLEIKGDDFPCAGELNWTASNDLKGGTPGQPNSIHGSFTDTEGPQIRNTRAINPSTLIISFDEPVDSNSAVHTDHYSIDKGIGISKAQCLPPLFNEVQLLLSASLQEKIVYSISIAGVPDCIGNTGSAIQIAQTGLPSVPEKEDIIINEILFNPKPGGHDYIEFYNKSNKIIDASSLFIANRTNSTLISSITRISPDTFYILPGNYIAVTEDKASLKNNYWVKNEHAVKQMNSLPSYPDDKGFVVLLNQEGEIIDEVNYSDDWHFKLLPDFESVSLERINPNTISQNELNWHSASSTSGFGTPGYQNSQYLTADRTNGTITISPSVFSPDNDGHDDILSIYYKLQGPGYVATVIIYDAIGRPVKTLVQGDVLGIEGSWTWNGLGADHQPLPVGLYIIYTDLFNLAGNRKQVKNQVVMARKI
jgi:hypothetical protein